MRSGLSKALIGWAAAMLAVAGCGTSSTDPLPDASPPVQETMDSAAATAADLAVTLGQLHGGNGQATCPGDGALHRGDALRCHWFGVGEEPLPVYVSVLDDTGRFVFRDARYSPVPEDYPEGTTSCRILSEPPPDAVMTSDSGSGLGFPLLLYFWMAAGSPASMDDDGNGIPCETVYPAEIVQRVLASPLVAQPAPTAPASMDDVAAYAEARMAGTAGTGELRCTFTLGDAGAEDVAAGTAARCAFFMDGSPPNYWVSEPLHIVLSVLDGTGRFLLASGGVCCGEAPAPDAYPDTASCADFLTTPPDWGGGDFQRHALEYGQVLHWWYWHDQPVTHDPDGDGRPCEDVYPPEVVNPTLDGWLQP